MPSDRRDRARRRRGASAASTPSNASPKTPRNARAAWRQRLDSIGGIPVLSVLVIIVAASVFFIAQAAGGQPSGADLMGVEYGDVRRDHLAVGSITEAPSQPPAGGPHYPAPWPTGVFSEEPADGYLVHSLEHGIIWVSYQPDMVTPEQLAALTNLVEDNRGDAILAPRSANDAPVYVMSWGRRLQPAADDIETIRRFISTNRDRSPEPGVR
jgi:hypothetical protein